MTDVTADEVMADPHRGDMLVYDGKGWCVSRRDWQSIHVSNPVLMTFSQIDRQKAYDHLSRIQNGVTSLDIENYLAKENTND